MLTRNLRNNIILATLVAIICNTIAPAWADEPTLPVSDNEEVTLTDLRDMGLILLQIKQQSINIYMEATRKKVNFSAKPKVEDLKFIRKADIKDKADYLATRPEWLTYYVGTMEPLIHLFQVKAGTSDKKTEDVYVPRSTKAKFVKLLNKYDQGVGKMNKHLTNIFDMISEKKNNIKIAKQAVHLYDAAQELEKTRRKAFKLVKGAKDREDLVKIIFTPKGSKG